MTVEQGKIGILLVNLGTPDATSYWPMRRYLSEFLSDKRIVDAPSWKWQPILQLVILTRRPFSSGRAYESIWNHDAGESPLLTITKAQTEKIKAAFDGRAVVDFAMRYGNPSVKSKIQQLIDQGVDRILCFPLYPQYAGATTGTANDAVFRVLEKTLNQPALRTVPPYYTDAGYIDALANSVRETYATALQKPDVLVVSFHGLPQRYVDEGDPYYDHCVETTRLLRKALGMDENQLVMAFQSRFGPTEWIKPACVDKVAELAKSGVKNIAVIAPGFSADCIETLEEINEEIKDSFVDAGGEGFTYIPCLNDRDDHMDALTRIIENELSGWLPAKETR